MFFNINVQKKKKEKKYLSDSLIPETVKRNIVVCENVRFFSPVLTHSCKQTRTVSTKLRRRPDTDGGKNIYFF